MRVGPQRVVFVESIGQSWNVEIGRIAESSAARAQERIVKVWIAERAAVGLAISLRVIKRRFWPCEYRQDRLKGFNKMQAGLSGGFWEGG